MLDCEISTIQTVWAEFVWLTEYTQYIQICWSFNSKIHDRSMKGIKLEGLKFKIQSADLVGL